ncbi:zinc finger protein 62 homolog isoform X2 [Boleophthalmus pectinirostris]|uniref:zinc finger protein 62 homolog isoform X2 n=1 Tax=Boleophthalmus pectinirostris TaxID=150288 RepID=UPI00242AF671|nr:zinc finger protein 62 homolog isoform X2 [Boleophthalmus pectinirostris]
MDEAAVGLIEEESGQNVVSQDDHEEDQTSGNEQPSPENSTERDGVFCCQKCGDAFREEATYLMHLQQHSQESDNTCQDTPSTYEKDAEMNHETTVHDLHSQDDTENSEVIPNDLSEQMDTGINRQQPYQCEECGKSYEVFGYFLNHQRSHRQASKSVFHNLEHLQKKSFQCEFCGRSYSRASALDAHRRCHEGKLVKKSRNSPESLGSDHRTEDKSMETPTRTVNLYGCSCGKTFATLLRLKTHKRFSRNGRCTPEELFDKQKRSDGFQCTQCNKTFSGYTALASHVRWHNPDNVSKFRCEECDKTFKTLTFFQRHQRLAHTQEIASKSFLHQVCQLQKKSFECKVCGLKFSRASALHSHELNHSDVYNETVLPQTNTEMKLESETTKQTEGLDSLFQAPILGDGNVIDTEDEEESLEPGDLIVKVISSSSSSESEDNTEQDENSDLELVCESDYEIDYGEPGPATEDRHDCPDCYRWFTNPVSLRVHRMWHDVRRRRQVTQGQSETIEPLDLSSCETISKHFQEAKTMIFPNTADFVNYVDFSSSQNKDSLDSKREYNPKKTLLGPKIYHCEQCGKGFWSLGAFSHHKSSPMECTELRLRKGFGGPFTNGHSRTSFKVACPVCGRKFRHKGIMSLHMRKHENGDHKCDICNRSFRLLSGLLRHRAVHNNQLLPPPIKSFQYQVEQLQKNTYSCPDCGKRFSRAKALQFHMKSHGYESGYSPPSHRSGDPVEDLQCPSCFALFNKKSSLRAHRKLCTKRENSTQPSDKDSVGEIQIESKSNNQKENHLETDKTDELKYKCKVCERSFSVVGALNFHKRIHTDSHKALAKAKALVKKSKVDDSNKGMFSCTDCGRRFVSNSALGSHKRWHRNKPCTTPSPDSEEMAPDSKKSDSGPFKCDKCQKKFFNLYVLQRHQLVNSQCQINEQKPVPAVTVGNKIPGEPDTFSCTECTQNFQTSSQLDDHIKSVHCNSLLQDKLGSSGDGLKKQSSESNFQTIKLYKLPRCPLCSMSFRNIRGLRAHKWQAHSEGRNKGTKKESNEAQEQAECESSEETSPVETKNTKKESTLVQTISNVNIGSDHDSHSATLKVKKDITQDISIILPENPSEHAAKFFKCDKCGKAFSAKEQLENHKTKAKSRPFRCALCCSGFWTENQLQQHFIWHDKIRGSLPNELRLRINAATAIAASVYSADRAISTLNDPVLISDDKSLHECQNCGKGFLSPTSLEKHKREYCNTGSYHCSSCPSTFSDIQDLIEHHQECAAAVQTGGVLLHLS